MQLSISNDIVSTKNYDQRDNFDFEILNFPFLDGDVPRSIVHYMESIYLNPFVLLDHLAMLLANIEIVLGWVPSLIGILGNETVDQQAKTSLSLEPTFFKIPFSNFKPSINKYILEEWQTSCNNSIGN